MASLFDHLLALSRRSKAIIQIFVDGVIVLGAFVTAGLLVSNSFYALIEFKVLLVLLMAVCLAVILNFKANLYHSFVRYTSLKTMEMIVKSSILTGCFLLIANYIFLPNLKTNISIVFFFTHVTLAVACRVIVRSAYERNLAKGGTPVGIYGLNETSRRLVYSLKASPTYLPALIIDNSKETKNQNMDGVKIFTLNDAIVKNVLEKISILFISKDELSKGNKEELLAQLAKYSLKLREIPEIEEGAIIGEELESTSALSISDLIGREVIPPQKELITRTITQRAILITGAGGSIGGELCRQVINSEPARLVIVDNSEFALFLIESELAEIVAASGLSVEIIPVICSVQDKERLNSLLSAYRVDTIFHAAAYKHVPLVEQNVVPAIQNNIFGTLNLAKMAEKNGVKRFILISTDKAVRPTNVMGATKRYAEMICQFFAANPSQTTFSMVRFGNVLGSSGSVVPKFQKQIEQGGPVTVTSKEVTRYFMTIPEAAQLVIQAAAMARGGEVYVLDMGSPVNIFELAVKMINLHGLSAVFDARDLSNDKILVKITGIRPGEKLNEELMISDQIIETSHPRIMQEAKPPMPSVNFKQMLNDLESACGIHDIEKIENILNSSEIGYNHQTGPVDLIQKAARNL